MPDEVPLRIRLRSGEFPSADVEVCGRFLLHGMGFDSVVSYLVISGNERYICRSC